MPSRIVLETDGVEAVVDLDAGGRLASLLVGGRELLVTEGRSPLHWGSYPMAPWANRVGRGEFSFEGEVYRLPVNFGDHAIHGTVFDRGWEEDGASIVCDLGPDWPFPGTARQVFDLDEERLAIRLEVEALEEPMPASLGWHPWFARSAGDAPLTFRFDAGHMLEKGDDGLPTGSTVPVPAGPWDDCFGALGDPPVLEWGSELRMTMDSSCRYLVVYDEEPQGVCIEPQTAPPNALNTGPDVVHPGEPLVATSVWTWEV